MAGQQIYAKIKQRSVWYAQKKYCIADPLIGWPFPVKINPSAKQGHYIEGGFGGCYRLSDVNLFVIEDGKELRIA